MTTSENAHWLDKVYNARNLEDLQKGYDNWAANYDRDLMGFGYKIPAVMAGLTGRYIEQDAGPLLDAGAGTGIMGETLALLGFDRITAIDFSSGMLAQARKKQVYAELRQMTLGEPLDFPDNAFAATIASGVFTTGHAPAEALEELIRITRPGGYFMFTLRVDSDRGQTFISKQDELERAGRWKLVEKTDPFQSLPLGEPEVQNQSFVYQVA